MAAATRPRDAWLALRCQLGEAAAFGDLLGSVFLLKQLMNQHALETLKELKGLEVRLLELRQALEEQRGGSGR